ncbi:MAG: sigma-70 family RNA polymerase sigma factor [Pirellulaceae bacterium]|nr:sigma-70 family RNA polymerase sigma factor [Pirellulaceae bacterium]
MTTDDPQLIEATLRGDSAAYSTLVRKYQDRLLTALVHVGGSREEAEDVAQEAFVQAYLKLATFAGGSSFYTWLYRIAFNAAISRRRKRRGEASLDQSREASGSEPADDSESADERLLRRERAVQVRQALSQLAEEFRSVLVLREVEGCDYDTIAEILDLPVGTVRSRLHRARLQLKEQLLEVLAEKTRTAPGGTKD